MAALSRLLSRLLLLLTRLLLVRERLARFRHRYGQPAEVRSAFEEAMGLK